MSNIASVPAGSRGPQPNTYPVGFITVAQDGSGTYNCDGAADDVEIQAAIDYIESLGGGTVFLKGSSTVYDITTTLTIASNNVRIQGEGTATTLKLHNAANVNGMTIGTSGAAGYTNVVLQDFCFDGNKANQNGNNVTAGTSSGCVMQSCSQCVFRNVSFNNWTVYGLYIGGTSFVRNGHHRVIGCEFSNNYFDGVTFNFCNYNLIENCITQGNGHGGIFDKGSMGNIINGNNCSLNNYAAGYGNGIVLISAVSGIYTNNNCSKGLASGFGIQDIHSAIIANNICSNNSSDGIHGLGVKQSVIANNICNNNGQAAGSYRSGIFISPDATATYVPTGNTIIGNQCGNNSGTTQNYGIYTSATADLNLVTNNYLFSNAVSGVILAGSSNTTANNVTV